MQLFFANVVVEQPQDLGQVIDGDFLPVAGVVELKDLLNLRGLVLLKGLRDVILGEDEAVVNFLLLDRRC